MKKQELQTQNKQKPTITDRVYRLLKRPLWNPMNVWDPGSFFDESVFSRLNIPSADISETETEIHITADVPGYKAEDISVEADENTLSIYGKTEEEIEEKDEQFHRKERSVGEFQRSFVLPTYADLEKIDCECKNGVLKITIPKKQRRNTGKKIEVRKGK